MKRPFRFCSYTNPEYGVPFLDENQWKEMLRAYPDKRARSEALVNCILLKSKSILPERSFDMEYVKEMFVKARQIDLAQWLTKDEGKVFMKHMEYKFQIKRPIAIIQLGHQWNVISDYFQRDERMKCGGYSRYSPYALWTGKGMTQKEHHNELLTLVSGLWRMQNKKSLGISQYQEILRLSSNVYTCAQFKVHTAATVYDLLHAKKVIDFSMGWGDRMAGWFVATNNLAEGCFIGCDPNREVWKNYAKQANAYLDWTGHSDVKMNKKEKRWTASIRPRTRENLVFINQPAEDIDWSFVPNGSIDCIFTSPPYSDTERYAAGTATAKDQSWMRYRGDDVWFQMFLMPVIKKLVPKLRKGGYLAVNIIDPDKAGERSLIIDRLYDGCKSLGLHYQGYIGMRMKQRPKKWKDNDAKEIFMNGHFVEPIWVWKK